MLQGTMFGCTQKEKKINFRYVKHKFYQDLQKDVRESSCDAGLKEKGEMSSLENIICKSSM